MNSLIFVCYLKDAKQCLDVTKCNLLIELDNIWTMSAIELCGITALFGIFLETNEQ